MQDKKLLIKFSEGDITAVEAKYYKNCLKNMYNKFISKKKMQQLRKNYYQL